MSNYDMSDELTIRHKKNSPKNTPKKGCSENNGAEHLYEKFVTATFNNHTLLADFCIGCDKKRRNSMTVITGQVKETIYGTRKDLNIS